MQTRARLARFEAESLAAYLGTLSAEDWNHSTACDLWQVGDLVAHLVWIGEFYVKFIRRALEGDVTPPPGSPRDERYAGLSPEQFYDLTAREYRRRFGEDLLLAFISRFAELGVLLENLPPESYEKPCFYHSGNRPLWTLADLTVQELAVHAWDIQSHTEIWIPLSLESQPVLLERVVQRPQPALALAETATAPQTLRFQLSGTVNRSYDINLSADATEIAQAGDSKPAAILSCDAETFILILYRRLNMAIPLVTGHISVDGDQSLVNSFAQAF